MANVRISLTPASLDVIERFADAPDRVRDRLQASLEQGLIETEAYIQTQMLSGTYTGARRGGETPVALRSGTLRQSITSRRDEPMSGFVGVTAGPATRYARTILGDGKTTIRAKNAKYLTIPIADNLTPSGQPRYPSVADAMARFGEKSIKFITSRAGNRVIIAETGTYKRSNKKRGITKGQKKGKLLFVLKQSVEVEGTDALTKGLNMQSDRIGQLLQQGLVEGLN